MSNQGRTLMQLLKFDFNLNIVCISTISSQDLSNSLIHCLVFDRKYTPVSGANVSVMLPWGEEIPAQTTNSYGSVVFKVPATKKKNPGYLKVNVKKGNRESSISRYCNFKEDGKKSSKNLLLTVLMDLKQYRPGQEIHVRGLLWSQQGINTQPVENVTAYLSLVDPAGQEIAKQKKHSDEFGVFDCTFPTDEILPEGSYNLKIILPDYNYSANRVFQVKSFKKPVIDLDVIIPGEKFKGESLEIKGAARYFYGGNLKDAIIKISINDESKSEIYSREGNLDGAHFKIRIPSLDFQPGDYTIHVSLEDGVGRACEKDFKFLIKEKQEAREETKYQEPNIISWNFTTEQMRDGHLLIKVSGMLQFSVARDFSGHEFC
ncbi:MAG: MG2 domain-containing protein [Promethearchaeota archaeon]